MTRVARALAGFVAGMVMLFVGLSALVVGWLLVGVGLAIGGVATSIGFLLVYDVDPPS